MGCKSVLKYKNTDIINGAKEIINPWENNWKLTWEARDMHKAAVIILRERVCLKFCEL